MATNDLCCLTAAGQKEVVIGELDPAEYKLGFENAQKAFAKRISELLKRNDLRVIRLLRAEPGRTSFGVFRKKYVAPRTIYSCIACSSGESEALEKMDWSHFRAGGERIKLVGNLELMVATDEIKSLPIRRAAEITIAHRNWIAEIQRDWPKLHEVVVMGQSLPETGRQLISSELSDLRHAVPKRSPHYRYDELFISDSDKSAISFPMAE
jgi:hypothetical protein